MTYYFMFSEGSYSDYMVGGLYSCDHKVTEEEWKKHCDEFAVANEAKRVEIYGEDHRNPVMWKTHTNEQHKAMSEWYYANQPDQTFVAKHNMVKVDYEEFWR